MSFSFLFILAFTSNAASLELKNPRPASINKTLMLQLVNTARKKGRNCGDKYYAAAPALGWNDVLEKAALAHSNDMFQNNYFNHTNRDGKSSGKRMREAGYNWTMCGENIAQGYDTEKEVVEGWLNSPGHCSNIMGSAFKEIGVSKAGNYWTMDLGAQ